MGGSRATPAAAPGIEGGAAEEELGSRGRAGRFVSTAHSRPYVTMATASAWAGREPEPQWQAPRSGTPPAPRPSSQQLGSVEETRTPPPTPRSTASVDTPESQSPFPETGRLQRALSPEPDLIAVQALLCFLTGYSKALKSPSPLHFSCMKLCPRNGNSLKGEERAIPSDKLLSNWYSVLLLRLLQQTPPPPQSPPNAAFASAAHLSCQRLQ